MDLLFVIAVALGASFISTLTGFGFALVTTPMWALMMDPRSAVVLTLLVFLVLGSAIVWPARRDVDLPLLVTLLVASLAGMPFGAYVLTIISESLLRLLIGTAIIAAGLLLLLNYRRPFGRERRAAVVVGLIAGLVTSSIAVSGPVILLFLANQGVAKDRLRATGAAFVLAMHPPILSLLILGGLVTGPLLATALLVLPVCALGYLLAIRLLPLVDPGLFRRMTIVLVMGAGVVLVASELGHVLNTS